MNSNVVRKYQLSFELRLGLGSCLVKEETTLPRHRHLLLFKYAKLGTYVVLRVCSRAMIYRVARVRAAETESDNVNLSRLSLAFTISYAYTLHKSVAVLSNSATTDHVQLCS